MKLKPLIFVLVYLTSTVPLLANDKFTIAVIPDTQNMVNFRKTPDFDFPVDTKSMFLEHMQYIADNAVSNGGDIVFATSVGDVWQHVHNGIDLAHLRRGLKRLSPTLARNPIEDKGILQYELPLAREGYDILAKSGLPFSVAPGNHDYDYQWRDSRYPRQRDRYDELRDERGAIVRFDPEILGIIHIGGFDNFESVFSPESHYFNDKDWYLGSIRQGANSAQKFKAGEFEFLHIALEMQAGPEVIKWAQKMINENQGLPTIISTHEYLTASGERAIRSVVDFPLVDPTDHIYPEELWDDFIATNDQIIMVLSGHNRGQSYRVDKNDYGNEVHQMLSDYQDRGQSAVKNDGDLPEMISDGWLRLLEFDTSENDVKVHVRTYSTYFKKYSTEIDEYASWYKKYEQPDMTDEEFNKADEFIITLKSFKSRFKK
ncbi:metallophosphoesterase [Pseudemcibacter aquimaris]|uniref:metallophosphoesterase n=1 Tax=Pseudemcibacter aquimaris TaxID=2857064 RepID=UPI002012F681|nr:metallophosphoesterase [Pseudemcibacter aquimaris]MCC3859614.1 metallophosphoesterase [Pseudemcibacter aquimaris]WDU60009.1 metallophosphoesterase [Pseudemcibacter aquimaris]